MTDYTTLALVKASLRIPLSDTTEDTFLTAKITAASRSIDEHCNRQSGGFAPAESATARVINPEGRVVRACDGQRLLVPDIGSLEDLAVEVGRDPDWIEVTEQIEAEPTDALDRGRPFNSLLYVGGYWTFNRRVRITARWGFPALPAVVGEAALIQACRLYKRKDSPEGILGSAEWDGGVRLSRVDPDVAKLLEKLAVTGPV